MVFSALDAAAAGDAERAFAGAGHYVFSNARNHRMDPFVLGSDDGTAEGWPFETRTSVR
jgi:hypothetical protein